MNWINILLAFLCLGALGLIFGIALSVAAKKFAVKSDEKAEEIKSMMPGANCGGCGYAGCEALACAIAEGKASPCACPVGGDALAEKICVVLGVEKGERKEAMVAHVACKGSNANAVYKYTYSGVSSCTAASAFSGGGKMCAASCIGMGDCVNICPSGAIKVQNGVAEVNEDICSGCGACAKACPKGVIKIVPKNSKIRFSCSSHNRGGVVKEACDAGCITCTICAKQCPSGAIEIIDNIPTIDYSKCTGCLLCTQKCPRKIITRHNISMGC